MPRGCRYNVVEYQRPLTVRGRGN